MSQDRTATLPHRGRTSWVPTVAVCLLAIGAGFAVATVVEHHRVPQLSARVQAEGWQLTVGQGATLSKVLVKPGAMIVPGQKLLELADDRLTMQLAVKQREVRTKEVELQRVQALADVEFEQRQRALQAETFDTQLTAVRLIQERVSRQVEQIAWQERLAANDEWVAPTTNAPIMVMPISLGAMIKTPDKLQAVLKEDAAAAAVDALGTQLASCEQRLSELSATRETLQSKMRVSSGVTVAETLLEQARQDLAALEEQRARLTVTSPRHGTVAKMTKQPGDSLADGDVVLELFDDDRRFLTLGVPSRWLNRFPTGQAVRLVFPGTARREGEVASIPPTAVATTASMSGEDDSLIAIRIEPRGKLWPAVPIGTRVTVEIPQ